MVRIEAVRGDVTLESDDAIVNAANESLLGGGGVDGAIHRAAGPDLLAECRTHGGCPTGEARITGGHRLRAKFVIHAVGPIWRDGGAGEADLLAGCYRNSLRLADEHGARSIAFPAISTGIFGYPLLEATDLAVTTVRNYVESPTDLELIRFVCFSEMALAAYENVLGPVG